MFKVVWDKHNTVRLTMSSNGEALYVSPRPVFFEELDFLGMKKMGWKYPKIETPLMWACDRRYFYEGELVMEVKGGNIFDSPSICITPGKEKLKINPIDIDYLRSRNEDSIFLLEHEAMDFINQTYRRYKGLKEVFKKNPNIDFQVLAQNLAKKTKEEHVVVKEDCDSFDIMPLSEAEAQGKSPILSSKIDMFISSFSGGKDSQVLLDLVARVIPSEDFVVIFSDTGYELPDSFVLFETIKDYYQKQYPDLQFIQAKNHQDILYYWDQIGSPSNVHRWCCGIMKTAPLYRHLKLLSGKGKQPSVLSFIGTRAEESSRRASYSRVAKDAKHSNVINVSPIISWNTTEIWLYLILRDIPFNTAYRKGLGRVGCVICPFGSDWNEHLCHKYYGESTKKFLDKLRFFAERKGVNDIDDYIKTGNWKLKAGGSGFETSSSLTIISQTPDFRALITQPKENIFEWLNTIGQYSIKQTGDHYDLSLIHNGSLYQIGLSFDNSKNSILIEIKNIGSDIVFLSHIKRVLNKTTYCIHCEMCEVECPTGALSVVPRVKVNAKKCIHCHKCLDFKENGCSVATSIKKAEGLKIESKRNMQTTINRYNNFGFREQWLSFYFSHTKTFFDNEEHGLNVTNQLPPFVNWLRDSDIMHPLKREITETGKLLSSSYNNGKENISWEVIWVNLVNNSEICSWYSQWMPFNENKSKIELEKLLEETLPQYSSSVRKNAFGALQNTFASSKLGGDLGVGCISKVGGKPFIIRKPYNEISPVTVAYSLYKYAEKQNRKFLTVSEFFNENQTEGIYRQFGIDRDALEKILRLLQEESNHVLSVELNMGLDNINLREDLNSFDVLKSLI